MKLMNEEDLLRRENWAEVYSNMPDCVEEGMHMAFDRIRARRVQHRKWRSVAVCAACALVALGIGAWALQPGEDVPDRIEEAHILAPVTTAPVAVDERILTYESIVYAGKEDVVFHVAENCSMANGDLVELPLITAQEFGKDACEQCCAGIKIPEAQAE